MTKPLKILVVTTLYPHAGAPTHGVFVENRMIAYREWSGAEIRVVAPVAWFPIAHRAFGDWAKAALAPQRESRRGIAVEHPRYLLPPKIGMRYAPRALCRAIVAAARRAIADGFDFDILDAHYLYPDGVAAVEAAREIGKPVVLTARGSDVTYFPRHADLKRKIVNAVTKADAVIAVADALRRDLEALGAPNGKTTVLRNGVDLALFRPHDRNAARAALGLAERDKVALSVGHLIDRKGHDVAIRAVAANAGARLLIAGDGPQKSALEALARSLGCADRVQFLGRIDHGALAPVYSAADTLILASTREGWPNVLLEAMACGARVVASDAGGIAEVVAAPEAGEVVTERTGEAFGAALARAFACDDRDAVRRYAERFSWDETCARLDAIFHDIRDKAHARARARIVSPVTRPKQRPRLIFTVDTEEEFNWSQYGAGEGRAGLTDGVARLQSACEARGVKPLHFLTWPLLCDNMNAAYFRSLVSAGRADAGLHLHAWETPPDDFNRGEFGSWQTNLPYAVHRAKLAALADAYKRVFGERAIAHRAGRYGLALQDYELLAEIGVRHDFSPSPGFDFSRRGGPDFSAMTNAGFDVETPKGGVRVTPVSGALAIRGSRRFRAQPSIPSFDGESASRRAGNVYAPLRLTCEQSKFEELRALTRAILNEGATTLTFSLHSTSLSPNGNPYAASAADVDRMLGLIARYLDFFAGEIGGEFITLADLDDPELPGVMLNPTLRAAS